MLQLLQFILLWLLTLFSLLVIPQQHFMAENSCVLYLERVKLRIVDQKNIRSFREHKNCWDLIWIKCPNDALLNISMYFTDWGLLPTWTNKLFCKLPHYYFGSDSMSVVTSKPHIKVFSLPLRGLWDVHAWKTSHFLCISSLLDWCLCIMQPLRRMTSPPVSCSLVLDELFVLIPRQYSASTVSPSFSKASLHSS